MPLSRVRTVSHDLVVAAIGGMVVAVLATGTAVAVSTTAVSITDASSGKKARVTGQYTLATSDRDPYSGTYARVDATGRTYVSTLPGKPWNAGALSLGNTDAYGVLARLVGAERLAVDSLTLTGMSGSGVIRGDLVVFVGSTTTGNCENLTGATFTRHEEFAFAVAATEMEQLTFPTPLVLSKASAAGKVTCVSISVNSAPSTYGVEFSAAGFKV